MGARRVSEWGRSLTDVGAVARIAPIADYGCTEDGRPYLATYVTKSLSDHLRRVGQPPAHLVCEIGATVADALATAHANGVVHAAVCPATILLFDDGARLAGFGAAAPGLTGPLGVWAFTAPEHRAAAAAGNQVGSPAGDVFALAATLCVALSGVLPWADPETWADAADLPSGQGAPLWVLVLRAALSTDPDLRPSAEELGEALRMSKPAPLAVFVGRKVDLRGLIPRAVRRLAATSVDAMADVTLPVVGRAGGDGRARTRRGVRRAASCRNHRSARPPVRRRPRSSSSPGRLTLYNLGGVGIDQRRGASRPASAPHDVGGARALLAEARTTSETFLNEVGPATRAPATSYTGRESSPCRASGRDQLHVPVSHEARLLSAAGPSRRGNAHG